MDRRDAFRTTSPHFGEMLGPAAYVAGRLPPEGKPRPCCVEDCEGPAFRLELLCFSVFSFLSGCVVTGVAIWLWY